MIFGSICSGIEAASVAWAPLGWRPAFFAEIDKFPCELLRHHYAETPNLGDVTRFKEWPDAAINVLVGGTPCQSFSVAGLRKGLDDPRGNLALVYLAIAARYRPRWLVWENVPGVLSSDGGRDFGAFLGGLGELGYGFAYRVLDAQHVRVDGLERAVPQRRRRVFVVGHLGDWRRAAAVLFERESLCGHSPPRREARERVAPTIAARTRGGGGLGTDFDCDGGLIAAPLGAGDGNRGWRNDLDQGAFIPVAHSLRADGFDASEDGTGRGTPLVTEPVSFDWQAGGGGNDQSFRGKSRAYIVDKPGATRSLIANRTPAIAFSCKDHGADAGETAPTLRAMGHDGSHANAGGQVAVAFTQNQQGDVLTGEVMHSLGTNQNATGRNAINVSTGWAVRRLTPLECERLQGFPQITETLTVFVCSSDRQKTAVLAEISNPKSPLYACHVGANELTQSAENAAHGSVINLLDREWPVALNALTELERGEVQLLRTGRLLWSANVAAKVSASPLLMPAVSFVRLGALLMDDEDQPTKHGRAALPLSTRNSSRPWNGNRFAAVCGQETDALAKDAGKFTESVSRFTKSTTSEAGHYSPPCASTWETYCSCVVAAISGFIPSETRAANTYVVRIEASRGYTAIPYRGKPAADGPRYKALGNSMAVNVMRWIGRRIQMVEDLQ